MLGQERAPVTGHPQKGHNMCCGSELSVFQLVAILRNPIFQFLPFKGYIQLAERRASAHGFKLQVSPSFGVLSKADLISHRSHVACPGPSTTQIFVQDGQMADMQRPVPAAPNPTFQHRRLSCCLPEAHFLSFSVCMSHQRDPNSEQASPGLFLGGKEEQIT